jgi:hypothetical protein
MTEDNVPAGKLKKYEKPIFFAFLKSLKKGVGSGLGSRSGSGSISRGTDPRIGIRTKMSQISNTASK